MTTTPTLVPIRPSARETWLILGSRYALTYPVYVLYAIPVVLSTVLLAETAPAPTHWTNWLILGIVAWVVPVLALIAMRVLFLPNKPRPSRPLLTLGALFVAALLRAVLYNVTEAALGLSLIHI
jgi:hypothetical protein